MAINNGINVQLMDNNKMSFTIGGVVFQKELDDIGIRFLYFVTKLFLVGTKFIDNNSIVLPQNIRFIL